MTSKNTMNIIIIIITRNRLMSSKKETFE